MKKVLDFLLKRVYNSTSMKIFLLFLSLFLGFPASAHTLTSEDYLKCVADPRLALLFQIEDMKEQGISKQDLIASINKTLPTKRIEEILKEINFAYDKVHKINAPTSAFLECLSK